MGTNTPIQPVPRPILCNPYEEPKDHWKYNKDTGQAHQAGFRRPAGYWYKTQKVGSAQQHLFADEEFDDLPLVNLLRDDIRKWREADYRGASPVTRDLLHHWNRPDRHRRLFFCQREAVETLIYLAEIRIPGRTGSLRFKPGLTDEDLARLLRAERPSFKASGRGIGFQPMSTTSTDSTSPTSATDWYPRLLDEPTEPGSLGLHRLGCKMATGSGKTVVMAMLISWAFCNRAQNPLSTEFPSAVLICCPNLTVKERLQVLRPEHPQNYYAEFDIVPVKYRDLLPRGKVLITNWHALAPESANAESGRSYRVVNKGEEDPRAFTQRVLADLDGLARLPIMVLNDEGHHCYRPKAEDQPDDDSDSSLRPPRLREKLSDTEQVIAIAGDEEDEAEEARIWLGGLDKINNLYRGTGFQPVSTSSTRSSSPPADTNRGILFCVDLSATPFYIKGSGHPEGSPFPWLVSDFGLVDAIESGIVKIPRLPVSDNTGRPDPKYFRLWHTIISELQPGEWNPGKRKPKAEVVYRSAQGSLQQLAGQWKERFEYIQNASQGQEKSPPVLIIVCDNTDIAEVFYRKISGEHEEDIVTPEEAEEVLGENGDAEPAPESPRKRGTGKKKTHTIYGRGEVFPDLLSNTADRKVTIRIDSRLLAEAESDIPGKNKSDAAEALRKVIATVGKKGEPGEHVRCVVSVSMLTEGWDANNVTHILGIRAFGSQLLCEQVVGRGLRRLDYTPDPGTGLLAEEYVDVYGIPFSVIPFKGRAIGAKAPEDKPKNHVRALEERADLRIQFPMVEGYVFALQKNLIRCDIGDMEILVLEPNREPTATFLRITAGISEGAAAAVPSPFPQVLHNRQAYYRENHIQTIKFEIARHILDRLTTGVAGNERSEKKARVLKLQSRHQLFPQVYRFVDEFVARKVDLRGCPPEELGLAKYVLQIIERLSDAIEADDAQGEPPLLPVLNRNRPLGSSADVNFKTVRKTVATQRSHVNQVVLDTTRWEQAAVFALDSSPVVRCYVRNGGLGFSIPYEHMGLNHHYEPDFIVELTDGTSLVLEIKGPEDNKTKAKHEAAQKWVRAVNNWGRLGTKWRFHPCRDPHLLEHELLALAQPALV